MDETRPGSKRPSASNEKSLNGIRTVLSGMIRTGMFLDFLLEEFKTCRTEAEKEVVFSALQSAKAHRRQMQKRLKRLLVSEPFRSPKTGLLVAEDPVNPFPGSVWQIPA